MYVHSMKELHNEYVIMTNYQLQKELSLDYKNYGKPVVPNIRNKTTNISTIKPYKITKREGIKFGMQ